jgi:hypothetical protein
MGGAMGQQMAAAERLKSHDQAWLVLWRHRMAGAATATIVGGLGVAALGVTGIGVADGLGPWSLRFTVDAAALTLGAIALVGVFVYTIGLLASFVIDAVVGPQREAAIMSHAIVGCAIGWGLLGLYLGTPMDPWLVLYGLVGAAAGWSGAYVARRRPVGLLAVVVSLAVPLVVVPLGFLRPV